MHTFDFLRLSVSRLSAYLASLGDILCFPRLQTEADILSLSIAATVPRIAMKMVRKGCSLPVESNMQRFSFWKLTFSLFSLHSITFLSTSSTFLPSLESSLMSSVPIPSEKQYSRHSVRTALSEFFFAPDIFSSYIFSILPALLDPIPDAPWIVARWWNLLWHKSPLCYYFPCQLIH